MQSRQGRGFELPNFPRHQLGRRISRKPVLTDHATWAFSQGTCQREGDRLAESRRGGARAEEGGGSL